MVCGHCCRRAKLWGTYFCHYLHTQWHNLHFASVICQNCDLSNPMKTMEQHWLKQVWFYRIHWHMMVIQAYFLNSTFYSHNFCLAVCWGVFMENDSICFIFMSLMAVKQFYVKIFHTCIAFANDISFRCYDAEHEICLRPNQPTHICVWQNFIDKAMYVYKSWFASCIVDSY